MAQKHYWVATCKNTRYHAGKNPFHGYRIAIGETDAHSPRPSIPDIIQITCDEPGCRKTYPYSASEIIRWLGEIPTFSPHTLFVIGVKSNS